MERDFSTVPAIVTIKNDDTETQTIALLDSYAPSIDIAPGDTVKVKAFRSGQLVAYKELEKRNFTVTIAAES